MGGRYEIRGRMSGLCPFDDGEFTDSLLRALALLVRFSIKYRIVQFTVRKEPMRCEDCADGECPSRVRKSSEWS